VQVSGMPQGRTLAPGTARMLVSVLGQAPAKLRPLLARAYVAAHGVRVAVRDGPVIVFGKANRIAAKWAAATRVLADAGASGARFIDVRLPERPAASGSAPSGYGAATSDATTGNASTVANGAPPANASAAASAPAAATAPTTTGPTGPGPPTNSQP
jgi:cell division protein FtsQ